MQIRQNIISLGYTIPQLEMLLTAKQAKLYAALQDLNELNESRTILDGINEYIKESLERRHILENELDQKNKNLAALRKQGKEGLEKLKQIKASFEGKLQMALPLVSLESNQQEIDALNLNLSQLKDEYATLKNQIVTLENEYQKLNANHEELTKLKLQHENVISKHALVHANIANLQIEIANLQIDIKNKNLQLEAQQNLEKLKSGLSHVQAALSSEGAQFFDALSDDGKSPTPDEDKFAAPASAILAETVSVAMPAAAANVEHASEPAAAASAASEVEYKMEQEQSVESEKFTAEPNESNADEECTCPTFISNFRSVLSKFYKNNRKSAAQMQPTLTKYQNDFDRCLSNVSSIWEIKHLHTIIRMMINKNDSTENPVIKEMIFIANAQKAKQLIAKLNSLNLNDDNALMKKLLDYKLRLISINVYVKTESELKDELASIETLMTFTKFSNEFANALESLNYPKSLKVPVIRSFNELQKTFSVTMLNNFKADMFYNLTVTLINTFKLDFDNIDNNEENINADAINKIMAYLTQASRFYIEAEKNDDADFCNQYYDACIELLHKHGFSPMAEIDKPVPMEIEEEQSARAISPGTLAQLAAAAAAATPASSPAVMATVVHQSAAAAAAVVGVFANKRKVSELTEQSEKRQRL